jgi:hypothetical protein
MHPISAPTYSFCGCRKLNLAHGRVLIQKLRMHHENKHHQRLFQLGLYRAFDVFTQRLCS